MPVAPSYIDFFNVTNHTQHPITLGDLVSVLVPAGGTIDLLKQPRVTKEKINQSRDLQTAVRNGWLTISKTDIREKTREEKQAIVADELYELDDLEDVEISGPDDEDLLQYDAGSGKWVNVDIDLVIRDSISIVHKTADYTPTIEDDYILCDALGGGFTISLPTAVGLESQIWSIKKTDSSNNKVTVAPNGSETIDSETSQIIDYENDCLKLVSDSREWHII